MALLNIVSDRGSNFVAAFRDYRPLFCVGYRLNNVVKTSFFGNTLKKKKPISNISTTFSNRITTDYTTTKTETDMLSIENYISTSEQSSDEDDNCVAPSNPMKHKSRMNNVGLSNNDVQTARKMSINDIPIEAHNVLIALKQCKKVVKYIKKVNFIKLHS